MDTRTRTGRTCLFHFSGEAASTEVQSQEEKEEEVEQQKEQQQQKEEQQLSS